MAFLNPTGRVQTFINKLHDTTMFAIDDEASPFDVIDKVTAICQSLRATQKDTQAALQIVGGIMNYDNLISTRKLVSEKRSAREILQGLPDLPHWQVQRAVDRSIAAGVLNLDDGLMKIRTIYAKHNYMSMVSSPDIFTMSELIIFADCFDSMVHQLTSRSGNTAAARAHFEVVYQQEYHTLSVNLQQPRGTILQRLTSTVTFTLLKLSFVRFVSKVEADEVRKVFESMVTTGKALRAFCDSFGSGFLLALSSTKWPKMCEKMSLNSSTLIIDAIDEAVPDLHGVLADLTATADAILTSSAPVLPEPLAFETMASYDMIENLDTLTMRQLFEPEDWDL